MRKITGTFLQDRGLPPGPTFLQIRREGGLIYIYIYIPLVHCQHQERKVSPSHQSRIVRRHQQHTRYAPTQLRRRECCSIQLVDRYYSGNCQDRFFCTTITFTRLTLIDPAALLLPYKCLHELAKRRTKSGSALHNTRPDHSGTKNRMVNPAIDFVFVYLIDLEECKPPAPNPRSLPPPPPNTNDP